MWKKRGRTPHGIIKAHLPRTFLLLAFLFITLQGRPFIYALQVNRNQLVIFSPLIRLETNMGLGALLGGFFGWGGRNPSPASGMTGVITAQPSTSRRNTEAHRRMIARKYSYIPDNYNSLDQVTAALREAGLESSNLILGIDFTKSNDWAGKYSFNNQSLHAIGDKPNPYEEAISIIGKTLAPFDEDNLIPCFGFGDATTRDREVFSFHDDHSCHGFEEVLECYRKIVPNLKLSGPTSFAPVVEAAVHIVKNSGGQYHVLVIIADGQVTRSVDTEGKDLSPQEESTINSIVVASYFPLSIVLVGVGDGPWEDMQKFDDKIPARAFDNFQFVNFSKIMAKNASPAEKEAAFALAALMEVPIQYKATKELGLLGRTTGKAKQVTFRPPPQPVSKQRLSLRRETSTSRSSISDDRNEACPICWTNAKDLAFGCGHTLVANCTKINDQNIHVCYVKKTTLCGRNAEGSPLPYWRAKSKAKAHLPRTFWRLASLFITLQGRPFIYPLQQVNRNQLVIFSPLIRLETDMGAFLGGFFGRGGRNLRYVDRRDPSPASAMTGVITAQPSTSRRNTEAHRRMIARKYSYIPDNYNSLDQVTAALREAGLESSNLILGIDFTKSNDWTGKYSFNNQSLHAIGDKPNPYEEAISIIGKTLAPFDEDNLIPCFGFGDATTHDREVFSFHGDHSPCHGFEEVLECYRKIVPNLKLSGYTRSVETEGKDLSPQEESTINSIVIASYFPLSIVLVGVGDGPWEDMQKFDDKIPARAFDNFQFVNFSKIMAKNASPAEKEAAFALAALMEVPIQYKATKELGLLGRTTGKAKQVTFRPPPQPVSKQRSSFRRETSTSNSSIADDRNEACPICWTNAKDLAFGCGHTVSFLLTNGAQFLRFLLYEAIVNKQTIHGCSAADNALVANCTKINDQNIHKYNIKVLSVRYVNSVKESVCGSFTKTFRNFYEVVILEKIINDYWLTIHALHY
ncbi:hypothetical protein IEQ34_018801 [Dendrobium chrysotoxum]|uniref:VWFA domain-containing protein n=1 Tax=Dendrobium chrysotoxum TaxID=161865 RepID=A0AAV7G7L9_DENCH|nr:hypothetical protein IEQ34_018801 [Dendrobium chrysotoxum]